MGSRLAVAISALLVASCTTASRPPAPPPPSEPGPPAPSDPSRRVVKLEDGTYVEVGPGTEDGFAHCCGDLEYMMEVDCSEMLLRCYQFDGTRWKQTFGRHCKAHLSDECYSRTCVQVCEAFAILDDM